MHVERAFLLHVPARRLMATRAMWGHVCPEVPGADKLPNFSHLSQLGSNVPIPIHVLHMLLFTSLLCRLCLAVGVVSLCAPVFPEKPTVLGASFAGRKIRKINDFEKRKVEKAEQVAMKCKYLPTSPDRKLRIATVTAGGQARYGWALRRPNISTFKGLKKIYSQIAREHSYASPDLGTLFRGHMADPRFMCSLGQITAAYRAAATSSQPPLPWNSKGPRFRLLIAALREYGWHTDSSWVFSHPNLDTTFSLDPAQPTFPECQPALEHALHESWRCSLFDAWKRSKRRDAQECKDIEYNSERCRLARLAARDT